MSSITVKLISIACVLAMLLTGMQVMTGEVVASGEERDRSLVTDPSAKKRLTISESSARDPATVTSEGFTHLVWIDSSENGEKVCWKKTGGDGVYTSTELLSPRFERIRTLDISASGGTVVVVYVALTNGTSSTYIVCSSDSGQSWGKNYVLSEGSAAAVSVLSDRAYVCIATKLDGNDTVTVIRVDIKDGEPSNGTMLLALPFEAALVDVLEDETGVHYAAAADDPCVVIYGHIGEELSEPVMIHSQSSGVIDDIELMSSDGNASALIASNLDGGSLIFLAESFDGPTHWSERILANGEGRYSDLSYASYDGSVIVAWANSSSPGAIEALDLRGGQVARSWKVIEGAVLSPSVFAESDGISCTWSEDDGYGTELYTLSNIHFRVASFDQVLSYAAGLDEAAFRPDVTDAREHLLDDLENVSAYIRLGDVEGAEDAIVHVMGHIDGFVVMSQSDDLLLSTSACENIYGKLQAVRNEIKSVGLHSDPFTRWAVDLPAEHGAVPTMAAFDTGATPSLATIRGCINAMSVSGEPGGDAPGTLAGALMVEPGWFTGSVNSSDTTDCFEFRVYNPPYHNQMIYVDLDVPSGFNLNMKLYTPSGVLVRTAELGTGEDEHIEYLTAYEGYHVIQIYWVSGSGTANYEVEAEVAGGLDYFYLDVGASGDTTVSTPGLSILDGSGWNSPSNSKRIGSSNSTMLLNLFSASYQANTSYMVGFQYTASSEVTVSVYNGGGWVDVGILPGNSTISVANVIVPSEHLYDALPEAAGMNMMLRFSSSLALDFVDAVAYSYTTGAAPSTSYHNPGVGFESGWTFDGAVANGTAGATMLVNVPVQTMIFSLEIAYSDPSAYIEVQQLTSSGYVSIGNLYRWGGSATISLKRDLYYDADASAPGYNIRVRFVSSIVNVTSVTMRPCDLYTMVGGVYDDSGRYRNPGINVYTNGHWSSAASDNGRTYRTTLDSSAVFFVNGAVSGNYHEVELMYRSSTDFTVWQWTGSSFIDVGLISASASWTTAVFRIDPLNFVDYMWSSQLNILFKIGTASVSVAELHLLIDSDNDGAVDRMEADRTANRYLDPFSADTDSDGLKDADEGDFGTISGHTSPWDPDTDDDGLLDGAEKWSQSWSTDKFYKVPNNGQSGNRPCIQIAIPSIPSNIVITSVKVHVGVMTDHAEDIQVWMWKDGSSLNHLGLNNGPQSGVNLFETFDAVGYQYTMDVYHQGGVFDVFVGDYNSQGSDGQVQYVIFEMEGLTNPLVSDTDGDGLSDGEEVNLGEDGWITNPVLTDTDQDTIWDFDETQGNTPCYHPTDPTCADTDGDGFWDNVDKALGDLLLRIDIDDVYDLTGHSTVGVFFVIKANGVNIVTERVPVTTHHPYLRYYLDIPDDIGSITIEFQAWEDSPSSNPLGDDLLLRIMGSSTCETPTFTYFYDWQSDRYDYDGTDISINMFLKTHICERTNTIVISGTDNGTSYGLETVDQNEYRYNADQMLYVIYVNNADSTSYGHFSPGINTVLLPRSVALNSVMSYIFADLQNRLSGTVFTGATLYVTDSASSVSSSSVIMYISTASLTGQQAEQLLSDLTHDSSGARIGENTTIPANSLYYLHLPADVLDSIAVKDVANSGLGEAPQYLDMGNLIDYFVAAVEILYEFMVSVVNFVAAMIQYAVDLGMRALATLMSITTQIAEDVREAVDKIVDAFNAFVTWAVEFIESTISSLMNGMIDGLQQLGNAFCGQMLMTCNAAASDYNSTGTISQEQMNKIAAAVIGTFFISLLAFGSVIIAALVILNVVTNVFSFLVGMVLSTLVTFIVVEVFISTIEYLQGDSNPTDNFSTFLSSLITSQGGDLNDNYLSAAVDTIIGVFDILSVGILKVSSNAYLAFPMALASSICGLVIAIYADTMASGFGGLLLSVLGLELSAYGLWVSLKGLLGASVDSNTKTAYGFSFIVSLVGTGKAIRDVFNGVQGLNDGN